MKRSLLMVAALSLVLAGCAGMPDLKNLPIPASSVVSLVPGGSRLAPLADKGVEAAKAANEGFREIPESEEIAQGEELMGLVLGAAPLYNSDRIQRYVNQVGRWIASHSERPGLPWRFAVIDSPLVNAGALPGGQIYISSGLLFRMRSESELAGTLAHEVAHVVMKHQIKAYQKRERGKAGVALGGALIDSRVQGAGVQKELLRQGGKIVLEAGKEMLVLSLDRAEEEQADRMGMVLAARAGYDPFGLPSAIQILQSVIGDQGSTSVLFSTHPTPEARLASLDKSMSGAMERYSGQANLQDRFVSTILGMAIAASPAPAKPPSKPPAKAAPTKK